MRNPDQFSSVVWFWAGILIALWSLKYGFGSLSEPGIGFITFFAGSILSLLAAALFLSSFRERGISDPLRGLWRGLEPKKVIYVLILLTAYALLLRPLGFLLCTFTLLFFLFRIKEGYTLRAVLFISILVTASAYLVFQVWLQVQFPPGIWG
jgi:putative tricarboxylic transport membrane protein